MRRKRTSPLTHLRGLDRAGRLGLLGVAATVVALTVLLAGPLGSVPLALAGSALLGAPAAAWVVASTRPTGGRRRAAVPVAEPVSAELACPEDGAPVAATPLYLPPSGAVEPPADPAAPTLFLVPPADHPADHLHRMVASLEAVIREQNAALADLHQRVQEAEDAERRRGEQREALAELGRQRTRVVVEALQHLDGPAASARIDAAVGRLGVPTAFARPPIAAFLPGDAEQVAAGPAQAAAAGREYAGNESAENESAGNKSAGTVSADPVGGDEPARPAGPTVVLPVPPPAAPAAAPRRRRIFGGRAA